MRKAIKLRPVTIKEETEIRQLADSQEEPYRLVQRAKVIAALLADPVLTPTQAGLDAGFKSGSAGAKWAKRFNEEGLAGLKDRSKMGRPAIYDKKIHHELVNLALQRPDILGYPFKKWTIKSLQATFEERHGVHLCYVTIWRWLDGEGFNWRHQHFCDNEAENPNPTFVG